jgi:hypothetical protein
MMFKSFLAKLRRTSPWVTFVSLLIGVIGLGAAGFMLVRQSNVANESVVQASDLVPYAGRLDQLEGKVDIGRQSGDDQFDWMSATINTPLSIGDRLYVDDGSSAAVAFSGRNYCRLNSNTSLDVLSLSEGRTQLALREGSCVFDVGSLDSDDFFEVGTPAGAIDFVEPGLYQIAIDQNDHTIISVLNGVARAVGLSGYGDITKGQVVTLVAAAAAEAFASELSHDVAGHIVDDYYRYRYRDRYDGRYASYDAYLDDPDYYYTYRRSTTYRYIPDDEYIAGLYDLDQYGDWQDVAGYGDCWRPRVSAGWAPYRYGYWTDDYPLGLTWVSNESWGWAPFHYGRWACVNETWYWVPGEVVRRPVYAPALVAFVQLPRADRVGWVPLGPGDPYIPRYYDADYRPQYLDSRTTVNKYINITKVVNYDVPGAVTVVPTSQFTGVITPTVVQTVDTTRLANTRAVVDPYSVPSVRQLAPHIDAVRSPVSVPVEVQRVLARPVMTSRNPAVPPVAARTVSAMRVRPIPAAESKHKLKISETGQTISTSLPGGVPAAPVPPVVTQNERPALDGNNALTSEQIKNRITQLRSEAERGDKVAKREMRQLKRLQDVQERQQRQSANQRQAAQQAQAARSRELADQALREQARRAEQQRAAEAAQQAELRKQQRKAARQAKRNGNQGVQPSAQVQQLKSGQEPQRAAARQEAQRAAQQRQQQAQQAQQHRQAEAARQNAERAAEQRRAQAAQQAQQRKAEGARERARQQSAQRAQRKAPPPQPPRQTQPQRQSQPQRQAQPERARPQVQSRPQRPPQQKSSPSPQRGGKKAGKNKNGH